MKDFLKLVVFGTLFAVPFLTLYVENSYFFPFITGKNFWFRILVDVGFAAWTILALYDAQYRPKISNILYGFGALLVVMFFADAFGQHPPSSFWSNFERMDGYVSLVHTFLYMVVLGSVLTKKEHWTYLLNTSLGVATLVALIGVAQYFGYDRIPQLFNATVGATRVDSTLGNAAYMAVYMLFHIFIAIWLFIHTKKNNVRWFYVALIGLFLFVLSGTGTRGTALGLAVGILTSSIYLAIFSAQYPRLRQVAFGGIILLVVSAGAIVALRDTTFVTSQSSLNRIAHIKVSDLNIRGVIWGMAWQGVEERPVLGWGQSNFNYVFNEHYQPALYAQEQWFDRAHDIFFDWLIAGGFLGLIAYLSIFAACAYYLIWLPWQKGDERFTVLERAVLIGLLAGYFTHNLVVFDNIVSYIFFAMTLGLIHARVAKPVKALEQAKIDESIIVQVAMPVALAAVVAVIVFVHRPGMAAAADIIDAMRAQSPTVRLDEFKQALGRGSFGHQEIVEQLAQQTIDIVGNQKLSDAVKKDYETVTETELDTLMAEKPGDARVHVFVATYYRAVGNLDKAAEEMAVARSLSPNKPSLIIQQGFIEIARSDYPAANEFLKTAYDLAPANVDARTYYAASLLYIGQTASATALLIPDDERVMKKFAYSDFLIGAANQAQATEFLRTLFTFRVQDKPADAQNWASLAYIQYQLGSTTEALATLDEAAVAVPSFSATAQCFSANITAGNQPQEGCQ